MKWRPLVLLTLLLLTCLVSKMDSTLCHVLERVPRTPLFDFYRDLTDYGKAYLYLEGSLGLALSFAFMARLERFTVWRKRLHDWSDYAFFCFFTFALTGVLTDVIKALVGRARPSLELACSSEVLSPLTWNHLFQSFPSGHTQTVFTFALLVSTRKAEWRWAAFTFAIVIAGTRLARNVHFFSDVLGGIMMAYVGLWLAEKVWEKDIRPLWNSFVLKPVES